MFYFATLGWCSLVVFNRSLMVHFISFNLHTVFVSYFSTLDLYSFKLSIVFHRFLIFHLYCTRNGNYTRTKKRLRILDMSWYVLLDDKFWSICLRFYIISRPLYVIDERIKHIQMIVVDLYGTQFGSDAIK